MRVIVIAVVLYGVLMGAPEEKLISIPPPRISIRLMDGALALPDTSIRLGFVESDKGYTFVTIDFVRDGEETYSTALRCWCKVRRDEVGKTILEMNPATGGGVRIVFQPTGAPPAIPNVVVRRELLEPFFAFEQGRKTDERNVLEVHGGFGHRE